MLYCGAVDVVGKTPWNEMFYIITAVFVGVFFGEGEEIAIVHKRLLAFA